jgi:hypothetical protein
MIIQLYKENSEAASFYKAEDKHGYGLVAYFENGNEHPVNGEQRNKTLQELYDFTTTIIRRSKKETPIIEANLYTVFRNDENRSLEQLRA